MDDGPSAWAPATTRETQMAFRTPSFGLVHPATIAIQGANQWNITVVLPFKEINLKQEKFYKHDLKCTSFLTSTH